MSPPSVVGPKARGNGTLALTRMASPLPTVDHAGLDAERVSLAEELREALINPRVELLELVGSGGMGHVFLGRDPVLKRFVAIKVLAPAVVDDPVARARFVREAETSAAVVHPNSVPIYLVGTLPRTGAPFFIMEFIEGATLEAEARTAGSLAESRVTRIVGEVSSALAAAHAKGLVHRDVKPANIMIEAGTGRTFVLDFGISAVLEEQRKAPEARITQEGTYIGTPTYMSPEQAAGAPLTGKTDTYSLGVVAYELLVGAPPFTGPAVVVMAAHMTREAPRLATLCPELDADFAALVDRCLAKNADARPSADEVARALLPPAAPVVEWPPPGLERLRGQGARCMRWWWLAYAAVLTFFVLLWLRPTVASPTWAAGEQSPLWRAVGTTIPILNVLPGTGAKADLAGLPDETVTWEFLVGLALVAFVVNVVVAARLSIRLGRGAGRALRAGYPVGVVVDTGWDHYSGTAALLNGTGVYALVPPEKRLKILRLRRARAVASISVAFALMVSPVAWLAGWTAVPSNGKFVGLLDLVIIASPLLAGLTAFIAIDRWTHVLTGGVRYRSSHPDRATIRPNLVRSWLRTAGRPDRAPAATALAVVPPTLRGLTLAFFATSAYAIFIVWVAVFGATAAVETRRAGADAHGQIRPKRLRELDSIVRSSVSGGQAFDFASSGSLATHSFPAIYADPRTLAGSPPSVDAEPALLAANIWNVGVEYCLNPREILFGVDPARRDFASRMAARSATPHLMAWDRRLDGFLDDLAAGRPSVVGVDPPALLVPLGWIGLAGLRDRLAACSRFVW